MNSKIFPLLLFLFFAFGNRLLAQQGEVNIQGDPGIEKLVKLYSAAISTSDYYRIQVGFGSFDYAQEVKLKVEQDFPDLPAKIDFDSPTYRVRVGRFKDKLDAERKFIEVRKKYPDAMLLQPQKTL